MEHNFIQVWKNFKTALSQRNAAIRQRQNSKVCQLWDPVLIENADKITIYREQYINNLIGTATRLATQLFPSSTISFEYKKGWSGIDSYGDFLAQSISRDIEKGFTQSGPHRADLVIKVDDKSAQTSISRGQQKKLLALMKLSQLQLFIEQTQRQCILVYDDLPAELDMENQAILMNLLSQLNVQLFVSAIEANQLTLDGWDSMKMFHVEHGAVTELDT